MVYSCFQYSSAFCLSVIFFTFYFGQPGGHLLGKSCPLGFPFLLSLVYSVLIVCVLFPFGVCGRIWNSIVSVSS